MNNPKEKFEEWLSIELQNKIGKKIGKGQHGGVYEFGNNNSRVIKISTVEIIQTYLLLDQNIKGFAKIYNIGFVVPPKRFISSDGDSVLLGGNKIIKDFGDFGTTSQEVYIINGKIGYVIMERVDTEVGKEITQLQELIFQSLFSKKNIYNTSKYFKVPHDPLLRSNTLNLLFKYVKKDYTKLLRLLKGKDLPKLVYEILDVFESVAKLYPKWDDIHGGQFGRNKKGELVVFDVSNDIESLSGEKVLKFFPTPNNIIKEEIDIFGVDDKRVIPKSLDDIPDKIRYAYFNLITKVMDIEEDWCNDLPVNMAHYAQKTIFYLNDCADLFIEKDKGTEEYEYVVKVFNSREITDYYVYSDKSNTFINTRTVKYDNVARKNTCLYNQFKKHDSYMPLETDRLINKFDYKDLLEIKKKSIDFIKKLNEKFTLVTPIRQYHL